MESLSPNPETSNQDQAAKDNWANHILVDWTPYQLQGQKINILTQIENFYYKRMRNSTQVSKIRTSTSHHQVQERTFCGEPVIPTSKKNQHKKIQNEIEKRMDELKLDWKMWQQI